MVKVLHTRNLWSEYSIKKFFSQVTNVFKLFVSFDIGRNLYVIHNLFGHTGILFKVTTYLNCICSK